MAEHSAHHSDMEAHEATYHGFLRGAILIALGGAYVLVALAMFAFGHFSKGGVLFFGFAGLFAGLIALLIDLKSGSKTWRLSIAVWVLFALFTAINVS